MRKSILILTIFTIFLFTACARPKKVQASDAEQSSVESSVPQSAQKPAPLDPKIEKLNRVLMSMTDRCKEAIPNGDPNEFLADLERVLQVEKAFPSDDLSLYYLIDKTHKVGADYEPKHLRKLVANDDYIINKTTLSLREDAADALAEMGRAAQKDGITLDVSSTYRSYETQERTFNYWVSVDGLVEAERESARPGTSQHQLGAAVDFGNIEDSYALTDDCKWLNQHSQEYGWSLSFPQGYEDITGYRWECWHFRYIGIEACRFQKKWFSDIQQFMFEFIDAWKNIE
jgi:D-alanyl-D-alanine carboxypeptidase